MESDKIDIKRTNRENAKPRLLVACALAVLVMLMLVSTVPGATNDVSALSEADKNFLSKTAVGAGAGMAIGTAVGGPVGAVIGGSAGAIIGAYLAYTDLERARWAALESAVQVYVDNLITIYNNYMGMAHTQALNTLDLYNATVYYLIKKAEVAARELYMTQYEGNLTKTYNTAYVMARSDVANTTASYQWGIANQYEAILQNALDARANFIGSYSNIKTGISGMGSNSWTNWFSNTDELQVWASYWISPDTWTSDKFYANPDGQIILHWTYGSGGTNNYEIRNSANTLVHTYNVVHPAGADAVLNLSDIADHLAVDPQIYITQTQVSGNTQYRMFAEPYSATKCPASTKTWEPTLMYWKLTNGVPSFQYAIGSTNIYYPYGFSGGEIKSNQPYNSHLLFSSSTSSYNETIDLDDVFNDMSAITSKTGALITTINSAAQAYYNALVATGGPANPLPGPDAIFIDPAQMGNYTWQQIYGMYIAYLKNMESWFKAGNSVMNLTDVMISVQSLNLVCRGDIYNPNGTIAYTDCAFTPYVSLDDMTLVIGNNTMTQPGFSIIWKASGVTSLEGWDWNTSANNMDYFLMGNGTVMDIKEIYYEGESVTTVTLEVESLRFLIYGPEEIPDGPQIGAVGSNSIYMYIGAGLAGVGLIMAIFGPKNGAISRFGWLMLIVGAGIIIYVLAMGADFLTMW